MLRRRKLLKVHALTERFENDAIPSLIFYVSRIASIMYGVVASFHPLLPRLPMVVRPTTKLKGAQLNYARFTHDSPCRDFQADAATCILK